MFDLQFKEGFRSGLPIAISAAPFGALFGAVAIDNGLTIFEATFMSMTLYAGASQLVGIELFGQKVAPWMIILSIFAVNFRHILYSAALAKEIDRWSFKEKALGLFLLVDPQFAVSAQKAQVGEAVSYRWYLGFAFPIYWLWFIMTVVGAALGNLISDPQALGFDVLLPIYFMGMVMGFRKSTGFYPIMAASAIGASLAFHFVGSPWHVSLGAVAGIAVAVIMAPSKKAAPADDEHGSESKA